MSRTHHRRRPKVEGLTAPQHRDAAADLENRAAIATLENRTEDARQLQLRASYHKQQAYIADRKDHR